MLQHEVQAGIGQFRVADRLSRDEAHDRAGCTQVLSEDLSDGQDYGGVQVTNPFR